MRKPPYIYPQIKLHQVWTRNKKRVPEKDARTSQIVPSASNTISSKVHLPNLDCQEGVEGKESSSVMRHSSWKPIEVGKDCPIVPGRLILCLTVTLYSCVAQTSKTTAHLACPVPRKRGSASLPTEVIRDNT